MYLTLFTSCIFFSFILVSSNPYEYQQYTFYYETSVYPLKTQNEFDPNTSPDSNQSHSASSLNTSLNIDNLSIDILKSSDRPYIISINNNMNQQLSLNYDADEEFNSIEIWYTPHRQKRRLRLCTWRHTYRCGWWGRSRCSHHHHHWCAPIAPPRHDKYWNAREKRVGRFTAYYPGKHRMHWYHYWGCAHHCRVSRGGLASIHSKHENDQMKAACYDVHVNPHASNQRDYSGVWRGHSCYIGLVRPFHHWDNRKKVSFTHWYPGEPNNWGHSEDCTESYIWHDGRWNDLNCHHKRSCVCQDPRGIVHGKYVGVQAVRPQHSAKLICNQLYGTELATITSDEDNKQVKELCDKICMKFSHCECYVGLKHPFEEWEDGTSAEDKYTNWYPRHPWQGHYHQCTTVVPFNPWAGRWNNLHCAYQRYFICNAQTAIERMDYHEREQLIAKRMQRHKVRWGRYQEAARRKKIRKAFFEKLKAQRAEMRKHRREQQQKMREYYRQMAFKSAMSNSQSQFNFGAAQSGGYQRGGYGAFGGHSAFYGDRYNKRRRLRAGIEENSEAYQRKKDLRLQIENKKRRKTELFRADKKKMRETDDDAMFYERVFGLDEFANIDEELREAEEDVNPSPMRCVIVRNEGKLYELCLNDDKLEIAKYMKKTLRYEGNESVGYYPPEPPDVYGNDEPVPHKIVNFDEFEQFGYGEAMRINDLGNDSLSISKMEMVQYLRINEFIYDHENNHKKQCYADEDNEYEICLEFKEDDSEMLLYVQQYSVYLERDNNHISFEEDRLWNKVNYIHGKQEKIEKCVNYFQRKMCVFKILTKNIHNQNSAYTQFNEYRIIVMKQMQFEDGNDEYRQMLASYDKQDAQYQY